MPSDNETLLQRVHALRTMLIDVGTGVKSIQKVEAEYTQLRADVAQELRAHRIIDVNKFISLWDWYKYWKDNGLTSYQSRRDYINGLYKPVIEAVELGNRTEPDSTTNEPFSARHGYAGNVGDAYISIREDAPEELRRTVINIARKTGWDYDDLLDVASRIGKQPWEPSEPIVSRTQSRLQLSSLVFTWDWYWVYDFIEHLYDRMAGWSVPETEPTLPCENFEDLINGYFRHVGIGWELREGKIVTRGGEEFQEAVKAAASQLVEDRRPTAAGHIQSAIRALSARPRANTPGAVSHATSSVECVLNDITGEATTLGKYLDKYPKLFHPSLKKALDGVYGYASDSGARHGKEGREPTFAEAQFAVTTCAAACRLLTATNPKGGSRA